MCDRNQNQTTKCGRWRVDITGIKGLTAFQHLSRPVERDPVERGHNAAHSCATQDEAVFRSEFHLVVHLWPDQCVDEPHQRVRS